MAAMNDADGDGPAAAAAAFNTCFLQFISDEH